MDDELDSLREKSTRASSVYDDLEGDEETASSSGGFLSQYTAGQRLILAVLLLLDIVALACVILVWTGTIDIL
ncbi:MAG: hypothetical protein JSW55_17335 [Chloroflexota bacterium]|nr:MAG: hypothetical protein JSW55_17335 [Chloroflexota bacterium]